MFSPSSFPLYGTCIATWLTQEWSGGGGGGAFGAPGGRGGGGGMATGGAAPPYIIGCCHGNIGPGGGGGGPIYRYNMIQVNYCDCYTRSGTGGNIPHIG